MQPIWAVGLMTGTVLDGNVDVALIRTDGELVTEFGPYMLHPYPENTRTLLAETLAAARVWNFEGPEPEIFVRAQEALTRGQSQAVLGLLQKAGLGPEDIGVVGFHGQTVLHRGPRKGRKGATRQLGDGALLSTLLGIPVAFDFRSADVAAGGQGAPLVPVYHEALMHSLAANSTFDQNGRTAVLNLGGVGNITWSDGKGRVIAFDTGPANAPINDLVRAHGAGEMDRDGLIASKGKVDEARISELLQNSYLTEAFPKSLDRFDFPASMAEDLALEDGVATLTAFTAATVAKALDLLPIRPERLLVCGGGRRNPTLMAMIAARTKAVVEPVEAVGWRGDAVEAECFAFLAARTLRGLPISFPETTGAPAPMTGGRLAGRSLRPDLV